MDYGDDDPRKKTGQPSQNIGFLEHTELTGDTEYTGHSELTGHTEHTGGWPGHGGRRGGGGVPGKGSLVKQCYGMQPNGKPSADAGRKAAAFEKGSDGEPAVGQLGGDARIANSSEYRPPGISLSGAGAVMRPMPHRPR